MELRGRFNGRVPFVSVDLQGRSIEALVDTGYDGDLMLPQALVDSLSLSYLADTKYQTADGKIAYGSTYLAKISWLGREIQIELDSTEGGFALLGTGLLYSCRLEMQPSGGLLVISEP